jgi:hypothetical protein
MLHRLYLVQAFGVSTACALLKYTFAVITTKRYLISGAFIATPKACTKYIRDGLVKRAWVKPLPASLQYIWMSFRLNNWQRAFYTTLSCDFREVCREISVGLAWD